MVLCKDHHYFIIMAKKNKINNLNIQKRIVNPDYIHTGEWYVVTKCGHRYRQFDLKMCEILRTLYVFIS